MSDNLESLIGQTITEIKMYDEHLCITTNVGENWYWMDADCCSSSWIEAVHGVKNSIGAKITGFEYLTKLEGRKVPPARVQDYEQEYYYILSLDNGKKLTIIGRNESNGYYGGWLCEGAPVLTTTKAGKNSKPKKFKILKTDYVASQS